MKLLWVSNAPFIASGYGVQTNLFTRAAVQDGHEATVFAWFGHHGPPLQVSGVTVLPSSADAWGNDVISAHVEYENPDATVILGDVWVFNPDELARSQAAFWVPIDHRTVPPLALNYLQSCRVVWSMSRHGERALNAAGVKNIYVPHGVDTEGYRPTDRAAARRRWGVPDGTFFAMCVAANRGWPSRKSLDRLLKAWGMFLRAHPDAILYLHTQPQSADGIDLERVAAFYGVPKANLRFPDAYRMARNEYNDVIMNDLYNAADVFLLPSAGEGFGVPALEAQAAGCPVILADATAQSELCGSGWLVEVDPVDDYAITLQYAEQANVRPTAILDALEKAHGVFAMASTATRDAMRETARTWALQYDYRRVWRDYMLPALEQLAAEKTAQRDRREARKAAFAGTPRDAAGRPDMSTLTPAEYEQALELDLARALNALERDFGIPSPYSGVEL